MQVNHMRNTQELADQFRQFFEGDVRQAIKALEGVSPESLWEQGKQNAVECFQVAANTVPAYGDFLAQRGVKPKQIQTYADLEHVPPTDKANYLSKYSLPDLCVGGKLTDSVVISSSSGSTGNPCYWPRLFRQDMAVVRALEFYLVSQFNIDTSSTLLVNTSGLGIWTAGECIFFDNRLIAEKYSGCMAVSPGLELEVVLGLLKNVAPHFEQTILLGYPPFVMDILDYASERCICLPSLRIKTVVYGEPFSENWRTHVATMIGTEDPLADISSVLGSSEGALIGMETPTCALIRTVSANNATAADTILGTSRIPSIVQYQPAGKWLEVSLDNTLLLTSCGALPLIRYDTRDVGKVVSFEGMLGVLARLNVDYEHEIGCRPLLRLPFAMVWGRADATATIYGVNIYPESVNVCLHDQRFQKYLSGRFVMRTHCDDHGKQALSVYAELRKGADGADIAHLVKHSIHERLLADNSEYARLYASVGDRVAPNVVFKRFGASGYFDSHNKHRYLVSL